MIKVTDEPRYKWITTGVKFWFSSSNPVKRNRLLETNLTPELYRRQRSGNLERLTLILNEYVQFHTLTWVGHPSAKWYRHWPFGSSIDRSFEWKFKIKEKLNKYLKSNHGPPFWWRPSNAWHQRFVGGSKAKATQSGVLAPACYFANCLWQVF